MKNINLIQLSPDELKELIRETFLESFNEIKPNKSDLPETKLLTVNQAAIRLQVSAKTVSNYVKQGKINAFNNGGLLRIRNDELENYIQKYS